MLDGITVLNKTVVMETANWCTPAILMCGVLAAIFFITAVNSVKEESKVAGIIVGILFTCVLIIIVCWRPQVETDRYRYEATIGDYIRFTDVYEKYDIVERRGNIWVLEDRE